MDKKDLAIIELLKKDSRYSVRDISKKTGIRPSTVHQRIKKLREEGVIERFTLKLDNNKVGEGLIVFMFVKTKPSVEIDSTVFSNKHIKEVFGITGEYDLLIKMKFKDVVEFNDFIIKFRKNQKIETTHTMVATATVKEEI
jgi:DNA-binding Lrp family transcriptional regulator